jgi:transcriptional antiterminator
MKKKALLLIGLKSRVWLCQQLGINPITLQKRLTFDNWKQGERLLLEKIYQENFEGS